MDDFETDSILKLTLVLLITVVILTLSIKICLEQVVQVLAKHWHSRTNREVGVNSGPMMKIDTGSKGTLVREASLKCQIIRRHLGEQEVGWIGSIPDTDEPPEPVEIEVAVSKKGSPRSRRINVDGYDGTIPEIEIIPEIQSIPTAPADLDDDEIDLNPIPLPPVPNYDDDPGEDKEKKEEKNDSSSETDQVTPDEEGSSATPQGEGSGSDTTEENHDKVETEAERKERRAQKKQRRKAWKSVREELDKERPPSPTEVSHEAFLPIDTSNQESSSMMAPPAYKPSLQNSTSEEKSRPRKTRSQISFRDPPPPPVAKPPRKKKKDKKSHSRESKTKRKSSKKEKSKESKD